MRKRIPYRNMQRGIETKGWIGSEISRFGDVLPVLLEPSVNVAQAGLELHFGFVLENLAGLVNRGKEAVLLVPVPPLGEFDAPFVSRELVHPLSQICNPDLPGRG